MAREKNQYYICAEYIRRGTKLDMVMRCIDNIPKQQKINANIA